MFGKKIYFIFSSLLLISAAALTGCEDQNNVAKAQSCLDKIDDTVALATLQTQVDGCLAHIAGDGSHKATVLNCSGYLLRAGLTSTKIINAVKALSESSNNNKEATMIGALGLSDLTSAQKADGYCAQTGIDGLIYFSSLSLMGTVLKSAFGLSDNPTATDAKNAAAFCANPANSSACTPEVVGNAVINVGNSYCAGGQSNTEVCGELNQAIAQGNGDPATVANSFWDLVDN